MKARVRPVGFVSPPPVRACVRACVRPPVRPCVRPRREPNAKFIRFNRFSVCRFVFLAVHKPENRRVTDDARNTKPKSVIIVTREGGYAARASSSCSGALFHDCDRENGRVTTRATTERDDPNGR